MSELNLVPERRRRKKRPERVEIADDEQPTSWERWGNRFALLARVFAFSSLVLTCWVWNATDREWLGTLVAYGPMWVIPTAAVVIFALSLYMRQAVYSASAALLICVFPLMGFCVAWHSMLPYDLPQLSKLRILTCNVEGGEVDIEAFRTLLLETEPDLISLQECDPDFSAMMFAGGDWSYIHKGKQCLASRHELSDEITIDRRDLGGWGNYGLMTRMKLPQGNLNVANAHLATPREGIQAFIDGEKGSTDQLGAESSVRRLESQKMFNWLSENGGARIIAGDFNLPPHSSIYQEMWGGYENAFATGGWGWGHTKFTNWHGIRIDHVLYRQGVCRKCWVGPDVGSDHRPVIADLELAVLAESDTQLEETVEPEADGTDSSTETDLTSPKNLPEEGP